MGILLSSSVFFAYPRRLIPPRPLSMNCASSNLPVALLYTASHATLSLTLPAVTSTASTIPFLSQAVLLHMQTAVHARLLRTFRNPGLSLRLPFSAVPLPLGSSSSSSIGALSNSALFLHLLLSVAALHISLLFFATCSFWNFFLFALAFICVPSMNTALGSTARLFIALFSMCSNISAGSSEGNLLQNA